MTIFDALRYTVSDYPTKEELEAIPTELFQKWIQTTAWYGVSSEFRYNREMVAKWYSSGAALHKDISFLRQLITEYDHPDTTEIDLLIKLKYGSVDNLHEFLNNIPEEVLESAFIHMPNSIFIQFRIAPKVAFDLWFNNETYIHIAENAIMNALREYHEK